MTASPVFSEPVIAEVYYLRSPEPIVIIYRCMHSSVYSFKDSAKQAIGATNGA